MVYHFYLYLKQFVIMKTEELDAEFEALPQSMKDLVIQLGTEYGEEKREEMEAERIKKAEQRAKDREEKGLESEPEGTED